LAQSLTADPYFSTRRFEPSSGALELSKSNSIVETKTGNRYLMEFTFGWHSGKANNFTVLEGSEQIIQGVSKQGTPLMIRVLFPRNDDHAFRFKVL
jgi:hypothetical protein